jgi:micrococcal nuclease
VYKNFALLVIVVLLAGCGQFPAPTAPSGVVYREETVALPTSQPTPAPSPSSTRVMSFETVTPIPTTLTTPTITPIPDEARGLVVEVIDGDTIAVVMEGDPPSRAYVVRYLGIDAPPNAPDDPWGVVAFETNRKMTNLKVVRLVRDQTDVDDEGRLLRYVYVGDELMSIILAEQGLARANIVEPDTRFELDIGEAEARAKAGSLGLWGQPPTPTAAPDRPTGTEEEESPEPETATPKATGTETVEPEETEEGSTGESSSAEDTGGDGAVTPTSTPSPKGTSPATPDSTPNPENGLQGP